MRCPYCIKVCSKCYRILVANESNFYKRQRGKYGLRADCKQCRKQYSKKYKEEHKEHYKEYSKKYYEDNKEYLSEQHKKYREANKEYLSEQHKKYYLKNPDKVFNYHNNRRLREENQGKGITKEQWKKMFEFFNWRCAYSGEYIGGEENKNIRSIDHVIPLNNGGLNEIWNLIPMYKSYNCSKKDTLDMLEWYKKQPFFSEERLNKIYNWIEYAYEKWRD